MLRLSLTKSILESSWFIPLGTMVDILWYKTHWNLQCDIPLLGHFNLIPKYQRITHQIGRTIGWFKKQFSLIFDFQPYSIYQIYVYKVKSLDDFMNVWLLKAFAIHLCIHDTPNVQLAYWLAPSCGQLCPV